MTPNVTDAINYINNEWAGNRQINGQILAVLIQNLTHAAVFEKNPDAMNWLFLANWTPQQLRN